MVLQVLAWDLVLGIHVAVLYMIAGVDLIRYLASQIEAGGMSDQESVLAKNSAIGTDSVDRLFPRPEVKHTAHRRRLHFVLESRNHDHCR